LQKFIRQDRAASQGYSAASVSPARSLTEAALP
jgi:hypothetical protein